MRFDILTLFPDIFSSPFQESILAKAIEKGLIEVRMINIRDFALDKHQVVDDTSHASAATLGLMDYDALSVPLPDA